MDDLVATVTSKLPRPADHQPAFGGASPADTVFLAAVPVVAIALVLSLVLPEVPLREDAAVRGRRESSPERGGGEMDGEDRQEKSRS